MNKSKQAFSYDDYVDLRARPDYDELMVEAEGLVLLASSRREEPYLPSEVRQLKEHSCLVALDMAKRSKERDLVSEVLDAAVAKQKEATKRRSPFLPDGFDQDDYADLRKRSDYGDLMWAARPVLRAASETGDYWEDEGELLKEQACIAALDLHIQMQSENLDWVSVVLEEVKQRFPKTPSAPMGEPDPPVPVSRAVFREVAQRMADPALSDKERAQMMLKLIKDNEPPKPPSPGRSR